MKSRAQPTVPMLTTKIELAGFYAGLMCEMVVWLVPFPIRVASREGEEDRPKMDESACRKKSRQNKTRLRLYINFCDHGASLACHCWTAWRTILLDRANDGLYVPFEL